MEQLDLTTPETVPAVSTVSYRVIGLMLHWEDQLIAIYLRGDNGKPTSFRYEGADAVALMTSLNKANLSTLSLQKRILNKLLADGKIAGTVSGVPD